MGRLLARINLVGSHVVIEALETLVEAAHYCQHREAQFWKKALGEVRKMEGEAGFDQLVMSLFGSEDKRVASAMVGWQRHRRA